MYRFQFDGEEGSSLFFVGGGRVVRCRCLVEEKSPDFKSPEAGISAHALWVDLRQMTA